MATSAIPAVIDALVSLSTAALPEGALVGDGFLNTQEPGDYLLVGVDNPLSLDAALTAQSGQSAATLGTTRSRDERGSVTCAAFSWNGDADAKVARDAAFALVAAVEGVCRTDPSLGVTSLALLVAEVGDGLQVSQNQGPDGAQCLVIFTVDFRARL